MTIKNHSKLTQERCRHDLVNSFFRDDDGSTAIEYGLIASLIIIAIIAAVTSFADNTSSMYTDIADSMENK